MNIASVSSGSNNEGKLELDSYADTRVDGAT